MKKEEKQLTGYPHIDKPWMKWYKNGVDELELPRMSIYDYMKKNNPALDNIAINYYGNKISYGDFIEKINIASKVLASIGVNKDDRIMFLMPNIPETAYLLYGATQIGAVCDYIDPRPDSIDLNVSAQKVLDLYQSEKCKYIISLDQCYLGMIKPIEHELKNLGLEKIIIISASDSMNLSSTFNYLVETASLNGLKQLKQKLNKSKQINDLIDNARKDSTIDILDYRNLEKNVLFSRFTDVGYIPNKMDIIVHTSGTSSPKPKPIPLTNDNLNSYVFQTFHSNMPMEKKDLALHILPYFAAFGIVDVVHSGLCHSSQLIQIPEFSPSNLSKLIIKYKPQTVIGTPTWFLNIIEDPVLEKADLSFIKMMTYGGDSMEMADELKVNDFLRKHNSKAILTKGHGMSELCGCASFAVGQYNIPGTLGIPLSHTIYSIVDPETKEPQRFSEDKDYIEGEIIISSPAATKGTLDAQMIVPHQIIDGIDFIFTRDVAQMNKDGIMKFLSRKDRSFPRFDGFKVKPYEIENVIKTSPYVKNCIITPYYSNEQHGNMIKANIVLEGNTQLSSEEKTDIVKHILEDCFIKNTSVSTRQIPTKIRFIDELPLTANGKVNYNALISDDDVDVTIELEETNISIDSISIIDSSKRVKKLSLSN